MAIDRRRFSTSSGVGSSGTALTIGEQVFASHTSVVPRLGFRHPARRGDSAAPVRPVEPPERQASTRSARDTEAPRVLSGRRRSACERSSRPHDDAATAMTVATIPASCRNSSQPTIVRISRRR
jgi:hypothetical protein